jgi:hypothetical protein
MGYEIRLHPLKNLLVLGDDDKWSINQPKDRQKSIKPKDKPGGYSYMKLHRKKKVRRILRRAGYTLLFVGLAGCQFQPTGPKDSSSTAQAVSSLSASTQTNISISTATGTYSGPSLPVSSNGVQVYSGCAVPAASPNHKWYIDPVNGSTTGDGSSAHPWKSLMAVFTPLNGANPLLSSIPFTHAVNGVQTFAPNPSAPIQPGDAIELMSGNYGDIAFGNYDYNITNSDFVTVEAAAGQSPVFTSLFILGAKKFVFRNIKVQTLTTNPAAAGWGVRVTGSSGYPFQDIILQGLSVSSQDDVSGWSQADWLANAISGINIDAGVGGITSGSCVSVSDSVIYNVRFGAGLFGQNSVFTNNKIDNVGDDFIDHGTSNLAITHNELTNSEILGDGNHQDFIQGFLGTLPTGATTYNYSNILIDSNLMIRQTDPNLKFPGYVQGIDNFDADRTNVTITNNILVTSSCWGISAFSMHGGLIAHNTVLFDDTFSLVSGSGNCMPIIEAGGATHEGSNSNNVTVENNIANGYGLTFNGTGFVNQNNVCATYTSPTGVVGCQIAYTAADGTSNFPWAPGTLVGNNNEGDAAPNSEFTNFNPANLVYTVTILPNSLAAQLGAGANPATVGNISGN